MKAVTPFEEAELEDLNNFFTLVAPRNREPAGRPSDLRCAIESIGALNSTPRQRSPNSYIGLYSDFYLDQTSAQFLSTVEGVAKEIGGSFKAVQTLYCKWRENQNSSADKDAWKNMQNKIYRALREKGYSRYDLTA